MSALGYYIHLRAENYAKYGTAPIGEDPIKYNYMDSTNFLRKRMRGNINRISNKSIDVLRARLKSNTQKELTKSEKNFERDQQKQIDYIYELLYQQVYNVTKLRQLGLTTSGNGYRYFKGGEKPPERLSKTSQWASSKSHDELMALREQKQKEYKKIKKLIKKINTSEQPQSEKNLKQLMDLYEQYTYLTPDGLSTAGEIDEAIGKSRYQGTIQEVAGKFGEMLTAACGDKAIELGKKEFVEFLSKSVIGDEKTDILISKDLIYDGKADSFLNTSTKDNTKFFLAKTQNKVDVEITVNGEDLFASVKDYAYTEEEEKAGKMRASLQEVSLFQSILFLNSFLENFGNHWINMHALKGKDAQLNKGEADTIVRKEVAYEALAGGSPFKSGVKHSNVFVFINRATGYVYVERTHDILMKKFDSFSITPDPSSVRLSNYYSKKSSDDRITRLLKQLHKTKIRVSLSIK